MSARRWVSARCFGVGLALCERCGSKRVECVAWVDPNTDLVTDWADPGDGERWCAECADHVGFVFTEELCR